MANLSQLFTGWRFGLARATGAVALVTLANILFLAITIPSMQGLEEPGLEGALFTGDCSKAKQLNTWSHLVINILGTVLLAAGNYTQQVLTAPTRAEIDKAHTKQQWLDIGVSSIRNLNKISGKRTFSWIILGLSSIPVHLFYNSIISLESNAQSHNIYAIERSRFLDPATTYNSPTSKIVQPYLHHFQRIENSDCIHIYSQPHLTDHSDLILVIDSSGDLNKTDYFQIAISHPLDKPLAYTWICENFPDLIPGAQEPCDVPTIEPVSDTWPVWLAERWSQDIWLARIRARVQYCLSRPIEERCRLILNVPMLSAVVAFNVLKFIGLLLTWFWLKKQSLLTLGDVMASFLQCPDPTTRSLGLLTKPTGKPLVWAADNRTWSLKRLPWSASVSRRRYWTTVLLCVIVVIGAGVMLAFALATTYSGTTLKLSMASLWQRGFGAIYFDALVSLDSRGTFNYEPISMALLANSPQLIISLLYIAVNGLWTSMMVGLEWNGYGTKRKGLRTTAPVGQQRKTYFLSLPLKYGVPLMAASAVLHWLVSQSIFLARFKIYDNYKQQAVITTCGYAPIGIVLSIIFGALIILVTIGASLIRMTPAVPPVGACSAVVSAACHPIKEDKNAAVEQVQWGVVSERDTTGELLQHCCVTSLPVETPEAGRSYN